MEHYLRDRELATSVALSGAPVRPPEVQFAFDLRCAWTYLAAERVDRLFRTVRWVPVMLPGTGTVPPDGLVSERRARVEARATTLRMPLVWPERDPVAGLGAMRIACYAAEAGRAAEFVLAAGRLAYCGGFDLDDPEILAEAAAAACLPLELCLRAFGDRARDEQMRTAGRALAQAGVTCAPALRVSERWFCGEERIAEAAAAARSPLGLPVSSPAS